MEDVAISVRDKHVVCAAMSEEEISPWHLLHYDCSKGLPPAVVQQLFASDKWHEPVPTSFFAGKNPLVSGFSDRCACVVQSVDGGIIAIIVHVMFLPSFLSFVCAGDG